MQINTKYNLNDILYPIWESSIDEKFDCEACAGTGIVTMLDNKVYKCPNCRGYNQNRSIGILWQLRCAPIIVYEIDTSTKTDLKECYIMYRGKESDFYVENNCFLSIELAQLECNKRNEEQNAKSKITS